MPGRRSRLAASWLAVSAASGLLAPWLPLRDPTAQPDGLVLRDRPPMTRAEAVRLSDGSLRWATEVRVLGDGDVEIRRDRVLSRISAAALAGPSETDWHARPLFVLGTDGYGRDLLSRVVHGARVSILVGLAGAALAVALGAALGLVAGLAGRWSDSVVMRATDVALSVPRLFLVLLLVALWGPSLTGTIVVLGATTWMTAARLVRGQVLTLRERDFVHAARASGAGRVAVALRHVLPSVLPVLLVEGSLRFGSTLLLESSLSFLGLGVPQPTPSWGNLIADGRDGLVGAWWIATIPGLAVALTVIAANLAVTDRRSEV